jgi:hypothetical protein
VKVLKAQAAQQFDEQDQWDEAWIDTGLVFTRQNDGPSTRNPSPAMPFEG